MIVKVPPTKEAIAVMKNGDRVRYDMIEEHDDVLIFRRALVGMVYSTKKENVQTLNGDLPNVNDLPKH